MGVVIGLLGGIASGKSAVASILGRRGLLVLEADAEARQVIAEPDVLATIVRRFGRGVLDEQGRLDRRALASQAFADPTSTEALNHIVHPAVLKRLAAALEAAGHRPVVLDVPLLMESPLAHAPTVWVFVEASERVRDERARGRNWSPPERARREALQTDLQLKRAQADHILDNNGSIEDLEGQVDALLARIGVGSAP